ncbi:nitrogen fixation protein NifX [Cohaesibacter marisflavi]|uniref:Nitrogen fixation protein NifX n=1 Tax=Cohaesibacter marisflavi TaxID=655353 RepID=A0A1I5AJ75_9HYPH|nr:NifB/NifX family molybdenum-iron cluster-binding protein [Cohaesibacter marisflavi]SFN62488.1 nitrogen fixation protein NifX [Cohaesibacter marisflavi]
MAQISRMLTLVDGTIDDGFEDGALKIAFATSDQHHVDQHFGTCESFAVYLVTRDEAHFHQSIAFEQAAKDGSEDKLQARIAALEGVAAVYCRAVGASAIAQLKQSGVQPIKVKDGTMIKHQLGLFQEELKGDPAFWVLRALESVKGLRDDPRRFDDMETEGWSE